uniref:Uncharacterized protein n=1 Tax=Haptolina ericina TaxID=156174 RepID=A0A7S3BCC8_9EUKA|mmetsp:Transcript_56331/g.125695  ORF Transcript_56331/g.125695 Transcript_56331/m.125695 type:complete len:100 (+) Transcript_56331:416-715(+)
MPYGKPLLASQLAQQYEGHQTLGVGSKHVRFVSSHGRELHDTARPREDRREGFRQRDPAYRHEVRPLSSSLLPELLLAARRILERAQTLVKPKHHSHEL